MATCVVTGDQKDRISNKLAEIMRQVYLQKEYGHDPELLIEHLQAATEGKFVITGEQSRVRVELGKFALLVDLGTITVPKGYDHATALESFRKENRKKFYSYNDNITDKKFSNPTRVLKPGDKLRVRVFQQVVSGTTTSEERLAFLDTQKAIYTGAQGASLVFAQKRSQLPKGKWYASFDEKDRLWADAFGRHRLPRVDASSDGDFGFDLGRFESVWDGSDAFLCFSGVE